MKNKAANEPNLKVFYFLFAIMLCFIGLHFLKLTSPMVTERQVAAVMSAKQYQPMTVTQVEEQTKPEPSPHLSGKSAIKNNPTLIGKLALPFKDYIALLNRSGAKLVLYDRASGRVLNELSCSGKVLMADFNGKGYSSKTRDLTADVPSAFKHEVVKQLGNKTSTALLFLLVMPKELEEKLSHTVLTAAAQANITSPDAIHYQYERQGDNLLVRVTELDKASKKIKTNILKKFI